MTQFDPPSIGTRARTISAIVLTGLAQAWRSILGFLSAIVLARLIPPSDFGLVATVAPAVALVAMVQDLGLVQAIVQRPQITHGQVSALLWLTVGFSSVLAGVLALSAPLLAGFYQEPRVTLLTVASAAMIVLWSLQAQPYAIMSRQMRFTELAIIDVVAASAGFVAGLTVAWVWGSYWALYSTTLATALVTIGLSWTLAGWLPGKPSFDGEFSSIFNFGSQVSGYNILNFLSRNADNILIAKAWGQTELGFYDRAYKLLLFPLSQINAPLGRVMVPLLSRLHDEPDRYRRAYVECITAMLVLAQPVIAFSVVYADDVFRILLGENWISAAPVFRWLGICALQQVLTATFAWLFLSQARSGDFLRTGLFGSTTTVLSFVVGLPWGITGVAAAYTVSDFLLRLPLNWWLAGRVGPVTRSTLFNETVPHAIATVSCCLVLIGIRYFQPVSSAPHLVGLIALAYLVYMAVLLLFRPKRQLALAHAQRIFERARASQIM